MLKKMQKLIASLLLLTNSVQFAVAALPPLMNSQPNKQNQTQNIVPTLGTAQPATDLQNVAISTNQLGVSGPLSGGINYSSLTGAYFTGQFLKQISEKMGFNLLGEYGDNQYRFNGTLGFLLNAQALFKVSAEQLGQKLPFYFRTGDIDQLVKQNAIGARFQHHFDASLFDNLSVGAYGANAPNQRLSLVSFISNGANCNGFAPGLRCINERNIAGATSAGADLGLGTYLTPITYLEGKLYYDNVHYNTIFSRYSTYNKAGYGGGLSAQHLLASNVKFSVNAELRKIYDTYNIALAWMPPFFNAAGTELSVFAQRVTSHYQFPNDNTVGLKVTFLADKINYRTPVYGINGSPFVTNIASWVSQPAVKMNQVLAISEELVHLAGSTISSVFPNFGPLAGGNIITISGGNFAAGAMVTIGGNMATITTMNENSINVVVPASQVGGGAAVSVTTPDGQTTTMDNGYLYTDGLVAIINSASPSVGPVAGGTQVTITGANFVAGNTSVNIGNIVIPESAVTVNSPVSLTFTTPAHPAGTVIISVTTPSGTSASMPAFTYLAPPSLASSIPTAGSTSGGTSVTLTGTNFATGDTAVNIGGALIPTNAVTVTSDSTLTFTTPPHASGVVTVNVATSGGQSNDMPGGFSYNDAAATATSLSPQFGPSGGGTAITITGTNFVTGSTSVNLGGVIIPSGSVTVNSPTSLTFTTPVHAAGNVAVSVTTPAGNSGAVPGGFTFLDQPTAGSLTPNSGPVSGGIQITLAGTNFVIGSTTVTVDSTIIPSGSVTVNSSTSLTFTLPAHAAGVVPVIVSTPGGDSTPVPGGFGYLNAPTATSLTPTFGSADGGTTVTVSGTGFVNGATSVTIGGTIVPSSSVTVNSTTSLSFSTPAHAAGTVSVLVSTAGGDSVPVPGGFNYQATPSAAVLNPAAGSIAGNTSVTISGTNFIAGDTSVTIGGTLVAANAVTVNSPTSLTFNTPAHAAGNVAVTGATSGGGASAAVPGGFSYLAAPTASSLSPTTGITSGGTAVTIAGTGFVIGATTVTIGGTVIPASSVTVNSPTSLTFSTPAHAAGNVSVLVNTAGGDSAQVVGGFTYQATPTAASLSPATGPISGATSVTVSGTNFVAGDTTVTIGGTLVSANAVTVNSPTSLTFNTPAHAAGNVAVTVATSGGGSSAAVPGGFNYLATPGAISLAPATGSSAGGTLVSVVGTDFVSGATSVTIGGTVIPAGSVTVNSATSLTFTTPAHAAGTVSVVISTDGGDSAPVPGGFNYQATPTAASLTPTSGPISGATSVTITGTNFVAGDTSVTIGGIVILANAVTVNSPTSLTFNTPAHAAGNVALTVATSGGGASAAVPGGFTYLAAPTAGTLSPSTGITSGGTAVTVAGTNFVAGATTVTIGGNLIPAGSVTVNSATSLTFNTPAHAAGIVSVSISTDGGDSAPIPGGFSYQDIPTTASLTPVSGPISGATAVTINGTNFVAGDTTVTIGGTLVAANAVTVNSPTSLTFNTPSHAAGNVAVTVATSGGGASAAVPGGFTYLAVPTAGSLAPSSGITTGGTAVTVTGTNFVTGATTVTIDGTVIPAGLVTVNSATSLTFNTPAHAAGNVSVLVSTAGGDSAPIPGGFSYQATPTTLSLAPSIGPLGGGTQVSITGTNFVVGDTSVTIDGNVIPANTVTVNSPTSLTFSTPAHAAANVVVTVSTSGGGQSNAVPGGFTYVNTAPTVSTLAPIYGSTAGGTVVTLTGTNFVAGSTSVTIGGVVVPAGAVTVNSATSLTFNTPTHLPGNVAVFVTTPTGDSNFVSGGFTYEGLPTTTSLSPTAGPISGGTSVTISGTNFVAGDTTVTIGGTLIPTGSVTVNSDTSLSFVTPAHAAGSVSVTVASSAGGISNPVPGGYTYNNTAPTVSSLSPAVGLSTGGTTVGITGTNFVAGSTTVSIGGTIIPVGQVTVLSATSLTFTTPAHAAGLVSVFVTTPVGNSGVVPGGFTYVDQPTATNLTPVLGPIAGGTAVTLNGTNFIPGETSINIGGNVVPAGSVTVNSPTSLSFSTPAHASGNVSVTVVISGVVTSSPVPGGFTYLSAPTASSLAPTTGITTGGTVVTVTGTNFVSGATTVTIGGTVVPAGSVTVNSATSLSFSTPAHAAGTVSVLVSTDGGDSAPVPGGFSYQATPTTASLTPASGPISGATSVIINGTNFVAGDTTVTIGGTLIAANAVTVNSSTSLTFNTPAHAAGTVAVTVATSGGGASAAVPGGFTYLAVPTAGSLTPSTGITTGGTAVTVTGTNFVTGATTVTIGGTVIPTGSVTVNSATSLTFSTPAHAAGNVSVLVSTAGGDSAPVPGGFTYQATPTAASLTPVSGPISGATSVSITGTNFVAGDTTVTIGGTLIAANAVTVNSPISLTFNTPAHAAGTVAVTVATSGGGASAAVPGGFTYLAVPTAGSLTPSTGITTGGTAVTVTGTNFVTGATTVTIGGAVIPAGSVTVNSATSLTFSTPAHAAGNVSVLVSTAGGDSAPVAGGFTYQATPTAALLTPVSGPISGATSVSITGTNFVAGDTTVTIGGTLIAANAVTVNSPISLTFNTPAHAAGNVAVTVATSGGGASAAVPGGFTYLAAPTATSLTPTAGVVAGGTAVSITGTNFVTGATTVTIGGIVIPAGSVTVNSATSLTFSTPAHVAGNVSVLVTTAGGDSAPVAGGFTYLAAPLTSSLTPTSGPIAGGTAVTITGSNFVAGDTSVTIGGIVVSVGSVTVNSATSLTFNTPTHAAGLVSVTVSTSGGTSSAVPGGFTYRATPTTSSLTPTSGTTAGGTSVTITGTNFVTGATSVTIGGNLVPAGSVTVSSPTSLSFSTPAHAAGAVSVTVATTGGTSNTVPGGYTYLAPSLSSCSAPLPSLAGIQLLTCVGTNVTLFQTTYLKASGSAACSTFPTDTVTPTINVNNLVLVTAINIPSALTLGLIGCSVQLCSDPTCSILGGVAGPVGVTLG